MQATSAGGIGILAVLAQRRGDRLGRRQWIAVAIAIGGLALLGASLAGGAASGATAAPGAVLAWLVASTAFAGIAALSGARLAPGAGLGIAAGVLYGTGDAATKGAVGGGAWLLLVPVVLAAHGAAFVALQLAFQRGGSLTTAGTASLFTNALPIAAGLALFHERLPGGALGSRSRRGVRVGRAGRRATRAARARALACRERNRPQSPGGAAAGEPAGA